MKMDVSWAWHQILSHSAYVWQQTKLNWRTKTELKAREGEFNYPTVCFSW